jgi:hypothetical protein
MVMGRHEKIAYFSGKFFETVYFFWPFVMSCDLQFFFIENVVLALFFHYRYIRFIAGTL